ncbi:TlpA family protein disulfide reductase [Campylobacter sp. MIT 12-8780]|uniref:TlpA family protein disulfide reductase n=1 Tax=unclassified Campylobacter TaxID=2593542 RepID=UPI0010F5C28E|nr:MULTISPECIES: TlpA disulfide reductase family protein [unclassified Campylobacter]NDJ27901.1 TlpA family protein disulfide reductase [Campylobacter sp. MIT 19-121]TKX29001.1 TlpA family protein disulfide reductase [Campylobacter sp. MIT 12-5580]TQR40644.1 TlpA family protein disulfide reductase [Campylobacter sp. MIT 12-8780]
MRIFITLFLALFLISCSSDDKDEQNASSLLSWGQGNKQSFDLKLNNGENLFIKSNEGKLEFVSNDKATLFVFFTTWCAPCLAEIPHLNKLQEKYQDNFNIIGILLEDKNSNEVSNFINEKQISFKVALGEPNFTFAQSVGGVNAIPTMILYSSSGELVGQYLGIIPQEMLDIDIQKAIM